MTDTEITCRSCGGTHVTVSEWESSDGGFWDHRYDCPDCGFTWWVDGPDA